jgi:WD40 repeat protein
MKNNNAWGFLVSCNQYFDYRTIVAPDFICEYGASSIIAKTAEGDISEKYSAYYREIHNSKVGNLTLVFRVIEATAKDTGISGDGVLKDLFGREIYLIEGIVFKGIIPDVLVTWENLEEIHKYLVGYYHKFWDCTTPTSAVPSKSFILSTDNSLSPSLKYNKLKIVDSKLTPPKDIQSSKQNLDSWTSLETKQFDGEITSVCYSRDSIFIAFRYDRKVIIQNWNNNQKYILIGDSSSPVVISENGKFIATAMIQFPLQNVVISLDLQTKEKKEYHGHLSVLGRVKSIAFTPNSYMIASGGEDKNIYLWDIKSGGKIGTLYGHSSPVLSIVISPDSESLASSDTHGLIKFWNLRTKQDSRSIKASSRPVNLLAFSPDSLTLVSGSDDYSIKLWNAKTGREVCTIGQHSAPVNSVVFSPDGKMIASAGDDNKIKIWEVKSKTLISELSGHTRAVTSVAFSPDGQTIISGSKDCTIRMWQRDK